jgi:hypothetical protein
LLFALTWTVLYLIHPSWALPIPATQRALLYFGMIIYFSALALIANRWGDPLDLDKPIIIFPKELLQYIKDNLWLLIICSLAMLLHIKPISSPIYLVGDEALFLQNGLWIYDYFGAAWHKAAQYAFWIAAVLALIIARKRSKLKSIEGPSSDNEDGPNKFLVLFLGMGLLVIYFILIRDLPYSLTMIRYPPLQKFLYLFGYFIFGINYMAPRLIQLAFYILGAVYIYRIIILYYEKDTALLGATVYLFSPIIFSYAHFAELSSGVIFFIIAISYYFLRYLMYQEGRSLMLATFFLGTGFLYKRDIFLMFFMCCGYVVFHVFRNRDFPLLKSLKILSLALFPIIPWMIIGKYFNWRNTDISLSEFTSFEKMTEWMLMIPESLSWGVFLLFIFSVFYIFIAKRDTITLYMGMIFTGFYLFYTAQYLGSWIRMSSAFYPTIALFLALFLKWFSRQIKWKHSFKAIYAVLTVYLIIICAVPSLSAKLITYRDFKAHYFPNEMAMNWIRDNVQDGEKVLSFRFKPDMYYREKFGMDNIIIDSHWYNLEGVRDSSPDRLMAYIKTNSIAYIIFPHSPIFLDSPGNIALRNYVIANNNEFLERARFNYGENYIYIHKFIDKKGGD